MRFGLIGGIGPAATDFYYRSLISRATQAERDLNLTMVHADSAAPISTRSSLTVKQAFQSWIAQASTSTRSHDAFE